MEQILDVAIIKPHSLVYYKKFPNKRYNETSKENLRQNKTALLKTCKRIADFKNFDNINDVFMAYNEAYKANFKKDYDGLLSSTLQKKIQKICSVFVNAVLKNYNPNLGLQQRLLTLSTFTLTSDKQHTTDKETVKAFVDFIDHLKKVDNFIIEKGKLTDKKAPRLKNYFWRAETTENGVIHFHLISDCFLNMYMVKRLWNLQLKKMGYKEADNSVRVESLNKEKINDVHAYLLKYMTKQPLRDKCKKMFKENLDKLSTFEKYRRPVMYKSWGCSRDMRKLDFPTFYENEIYFVDEMRQHMTLVELPETAPDFIKVFKGKTRNILKQCSYKLQSWVKEHYKKVYSYLYEISKEIKETISDFKQIHKINYHQLQINFPHV